MKKNILTVFLALLFVGCTYTNWNILNKPDNTNNKIKVDRNVAVPGSAKPQNTNNQTTQTEQNSDDNGDFVMIENDIPGTVENNATQSFEEHNATKEQSGMYKITTITSLWGAPNKVIQDENGANRYIWKNCKESGKYEQKCEDDNCESVPKLDCCDRILITDSEGYVTNLKEAIQECN